MVFPQILCSDAELNWLSVRMKLSIGHTCFAFVKYESLSAILNYLLE